MKSFNPIIILNLFLIIFILTGIFLFIFLLTIDRLTIVSSIVIGIIDLVLIIVFFSINIKNYGSEKQTYQSENCKNKLSSNDIGFTIDSPLMQEKTNVAWCQIEAIFLINSAPLDGEYFNFQYIIFAKNPITILPYENQKWYNKLFPPRTDYSEMSRILIDDYRNIDFHDFFPMAKIHLSNVNDNIPKYLNFKFGNNISELILFKSSNNIEKSINNLGFYCVFDRKTNIQNNILNDYRKNATL